MRYLIPFSFLLAMLSVSSCDQIPCDDVDCGEYGTCDETNEQCACDPGFVFNTSSGICECTPNATYNDTTQVCECNEGWLMNPITATCVNPCDLINCGLHGDCDFTTGACNCDAGYGPGNLSPCEAFNLKFTGSWTGNHLDQVSQQVTGPYTMVLTPMLEPERVLFQNFMKLLCQGPGVPVDADGSLVDPGTSGDNIDSACPEWSFSNTAFILVNDSTLRVIATVIPGMGGPTQELLGTYIRD